MSTKERILAAAYELFKEKTYDLTSIDDICAKCQLTKPAFYYHFSSKSELLLHYYDDVVQQLHIELENKSFKDNFWHTYVFCFSELLKGSTVLGVDLIRQLYITNLTEDKHSFDINQSFADLAISLIKKGQQSGQIGNQQNAEELFLASSLMFTGIEVFWSIKKGGIDRLRTLLRSLEAVFDVPASFSTATNLEQLMYTDFSK